MTIPVPGPFGIWIENRDEDHIYYQAATSGPHQDHIVLHELGHIICGHASDQDDDTLLRSLFPTLDPEIVRRTLRRSGYDSAQEREAEMVASIILEWASVVDRVGFARPQQDSAWRVGTALGDRIGWL